MLEGHEVARVPDGMQGIEHALTNRPAVVVIDLGFTQTDGFQVARRLRANADAYFPRLVALTGRTLQAVRTSDVLRRKRWVIAHNGPRTRETASRGDDWAEGARPRTARPVPAARSPIVGSLAVLAVLTAVPGVNPREAVRFTTGCCVLRPLKAYEMGLTCSLA
jgi:CheY-like chemotaxis protein